MQGRIHSPTSSDCDGYSLSLSLNTLPSMERDWRRSHHVLRCLHDRYSASKTSSAHYGRGGSQWWKLCRRRYSTSPDSRSSSALANMIHFLLCSHGVGDGFLVHQMQATIVIISWSKPITAGYLLSHLPGWIMLHDFV
jgi:hypothetical protein